MKIINLPTDWTKPYVVFARGLDWTAAAKIATSLRDAAQTTKLAVIVDASPDASIEFMPFGPTNLESRGDLHRVADEILHGPEARGDPHRLIGAAINLAALSTWHPGVEPKPAWINELPADVLVALGALCRAVVELRGEP
ncbi:MAG: hypothetical protein EHM35_15875 [Planctomycetaceae bacterium]|nr:MAG: hypothetical protein EHM35_15875 [Planctomycetaceae bacterium]